MLAYVRRKFRANPPTTKRVGADEWNADLEISLGTVCELLARLNISADTVPYFTASDGASLAVLTAYARTVLAAEDAAAAMALLGALAAAGGVMSGNIDMDGHKVIGLATPTAGNDAAHKSYVDTAIANLVASSPAALDTLNELAAALGDDANFATTVTNAVALKAPLASPALTGTPTAPTVAGSTDSSTKISTTAFVQAVAALLAPLASPSLTGSPTAPTVAGSSDSSTKIATTGFVQAVKSAFAATLAAVASSGVYADLTGKPALGTAAAKDYGTSAGNLVEVQTGGKLPALDASNLTNVPSGAEATDAQMWAETAASEFVSPRRLGSSKAWVALTDAATIAVDSTRGRNFNVTLGGNRTLGFPSGTLVEGDEYNFLVKQDGTGSRTLNVSSSGYKHDGDTAFVIGTTANKYSLFTGKVLPGATMILLQLVAVNFTGP